MATTAGFEAVRLAGDLGFAAGGVDVSHLIGTFVKSVTAGGEVTVQLADGTEDTVQIASGGGATWSAGQTAPTGGSNGDWYLRTGNTNPGIYLKTSGVWARVLAPGTGGSTPDFNPAVTDFGSALSFGALTADATSAHQGFDFTTLVDDAIYWLDVTAPADNTPSYSFARTGAALKALVAAGEPEETANIVNYSITVGSDTGTLAIFRSGTGSIAAEATIAVAGGVTAQFKSLDLPPARSAVPWDADTVYQAHEACIHDDGLWVSLVNGNHGYEPTARNRQYWFKADPGVVLVANQNQSNITRLQNEVDSIPTSSLEAVAPKVLDFFRDGDYDIAATIAGVHHNPGILGGYDSIAQGTDTNPYTREATVVTDAAKFVDQTTPAPVSFRALAATTATATGAGDHQELSFAFASLEDATSYRFRWHMPGIFTAVYSEVKTGAEWKAIVGGGTQDTDANRIMKRSVSVETQNDFEVAVFKAAADEIGIVLRKVNASSFWDGVASSVTLQEAEAGIHLSGAALVAWPVAIGLEFDVNPKVLVFDRHTGAPLIQTVAGDEADEVKVQFNNFTPKGEPAAPARTTARIPHTARLSSDNTNWEFWTDQLPALNVDSVDGHTANVDFLLSNYGSAEETHTVHIEFPSPGTSQATQSVVIHPRFDDTEDYTLYYTLTWEAENNRWHVGLGTSGVDTRGVPHTFTIGQVNEYQTVTRSVPAPARIDRWETLQADSADVVFSGASATHFIFGNFVYDHAQGDHNVKFIGGAQTKSPAVGTFVRLAYDSQSASHAWHDHGITPAGLVFETNVKFLAFGHTWNRFYSDDANTGYEALIKNHYQDKWFMGLDLAYSIQRREFGGNIDFDGEVIASNLKSSVDDDATIPARVTALESPTTVALTAGTDVDWDIANGSVATLTAAQDFTLNQPSNGKDGGFYLLLVTQDSTGSRVVSLHTGFDLGTETAPVLSTDGGKTDALLFARWGGKYRYLGIKKGYT